jgi:hypothetical protein
LFDESGDEVTKAKVNDSDLVANFNDKASIRPYKGRKLPKFNIHRSPTKPCVLLVVMEKASPDQVDQLESCRYAVVADVWETDGGTWELLTKVQS